MSETQSSDERDQETIRVLKVLFGLFPNMKIQKETWDGYLMMLRDIPPLVLQQAVVSCLEQSEFLPTVAAIRRAALKASSQQHLSADEAWQLVLEQVSAVHSYGTPTFSDDLITKVVNGIGWRDICLTDEVGVVRGQFYKLYNASVERDTEEKLLSPDVRKLRAELQAKYTASQLPKGKA